MGGISQKTCNVGVYYYECSKKYIHMVQRMFRLVLLISKAKKSYTKWACFRLASITRKILFG